MRCRFITNLTMELDWVVRFDNKRGITERNIKKVEHVFRWTRRSRKEFRDDEIRLQLNARTRSA